MEWMFLTAFLLHIPSLLPFCVLSNTYREKGFFAHFSCYDVIPVSLFDSKLCHCSKNNNSKDCEVIRRPVEISEEKSV